MSRKDETTSIKNLLSFIERLLLTGEGGIFTSSVFISLGILAFFIMNNLWLPLFIVACGTALLMKNLDYANRIFMQSLLGIVNAFYEAKGKGKIAIFGVFISSISTAFCLTVSAIVLGVFNAVRWAYSFIFKRKSGNKNPPTDVENQNPLLFQSSDEQPNLDNQVSSLLEKREEVLQTPGNSNEEEINNKPQP